MLNVFVTGADINSGKTFITAGLAATMQSLGYQTCVYKPVQVGAVKHNGFAQSVDLAFVKRIDSYIKIHSSYLLEQTAVPVIAAEAENIIIDRTFIKQDYDSICKENDCIITEGTGGLITPLGNDFLVSDMVKDLNLPVVLVVTPTKGVLNQTLLTINYAQSQGIKVQGVIINHSIERTDMQELKHLPRLVEEYSNVRIVGIVKNSDDKKMLEPNNLITDILNGIDIESVFNVKIAKLDVN